VSGPAVPALPDQWGTGGSTMTRITPFLWFDDPVEETVEIYTGCSRTPACSGWPVTERPGRRRPWWPWGTGTSGSCGTRPTGWRDHRT